MTDSSIPKFFEKSRKERLDIVKNFSGLTQEEIDLIENSTGGISFEQADNMIENAIGTFALPLGIAPNFRINGHDYLVPMVIEEPSVVAAASKGAKIARKHGGFTAESSESYSIGQIQVVDADIPSAISKITQSSTEIIDLANTKSKTLSSMGKGAKEVTCKEITTNSGSMLIVELEISPFSNVTVKNASISICLPVAGYPRVSKTCSKFHNTWIKTLDALE